MAYWSCVNSFTIITPSQLWYLQGVFSWASLVLFFSFRLFWPFVLPYKFLTFLFFIWEKGRETKRGKERNIAWLPSEHTTARDQAPQCRYMPPLGIKPATFQFTGHLPTNWAMPATVHIKFKIFFNLLILGKTGRERKKKRERERETSICCSTYLCILWLILVCALTRDWSYNLGTSGTTL